MQRAAVSTTTSERILAPSCRRLNWAAGRFVRLRASIIGSVSTVHRHVISGFALVFVGGVAGMSAADDSTGAAGVLRYPAAARSPVVDVLPGVEVADPYRWMAKDSAELSAWVGAENSLAEPFLAAIPARESLKKRLAELWDYEQYGYSWLGDKSR